jgi:hypothetical protein
MMIEKGHIRLVAKCVRQRIVTVGNMLGRAYIGMPAGFSSLPH